MARVLPLPGQRLSIRHGDVALAVPAMHPATPRADRVVIFELVLRRLYGEALDHAEAVADAIERRETRDKLLGLISEAPHHTDRRRAA